MLKGVTVKDFMAENPVTFTADMEILHAIHALVEKRISGAPVIDEHGELIGMLSEQDCMTVALHAAYHGEWGGKVSEYMNNEVSTIDADASIADVAAMFMTARYRRYPVVQGNRVVGQISRRDVLRALAVLR